MDINFEYYKIFYYVAKYKNITRAAAALGSNQPNVTRVMKLLEEGRMLRRGIVEGSFGTGMLNERCLSLYSRRLSRCSRPIPVIGSDLDRYFIVNDIAIFFIVHDSYLENR